jgi:hypothetical protein
MTLTIRGLSRGGGKDPHSKKTWQSSGGPRVKTLEHLKKKQG